MSLRWLVAALILLGLLASAHMYNLAHHVYFERWWMDIPMHLLGGLAIGTLFVGLSPRPRPLLFLVAVLLISIGWELFEYVFGTTYSNTNYLFDTSHDLLDDVIGAAVAYGIARTSIWR
ncbi:MAG TPA: hypothetical protein VM103_00810 [Candidatus Paceibacterota bacterium]|nr:hypothetical protein [Candidatus Paceibacterota bacterium]